MMGVLSRILRFDWLWNEVRVRGGAYGVSFGVSRSGDAVFSSYRDPSVGKTVGVYDGTVGYLRDFAAKNPDITKYIISTAAGYERPLTPRELGAAAQSNYFEGITDDMRRDARGYREICLSHRRCRRRRALRRRRLQRKDRCRLRRVHRKGRYMSDGHVTLRFGMLFPRSFVIR